MAEHEHHYTFGAPVSGWPNFDDDGLRVESCPFCANWTGPYRDLADHVREECGQ